MSESGNPPGGAPEFMPHRAAYRELLEGLWYAHHLFVNRGDGGLEGAKTALQAVARYIGVRDLNPELAAPVLAVHQGLVDVQRGIAPALFSTVPRVKERDRSSGRKHQQLLAAAAMEVLMSLGDSLSDAARSVSCAVAKWPSMKGGAIAPKTIEGWREACRRSTDPRHAQFQELRKHMLEQPDPRGQVEALLRRPPGMPS